MSKQSVACVLLGLGEISSMEAPTSPLDGAILKLPGKLDRLLRRGCTLPKGVADEIPLIKHDLEKIIAISSNLEDGHATMVRCWRKEVRELSYDMEDFVDQYEHATAVTCARSIHGRKITQPRKSKLTLPWLREKLRQRLWMANKIREFSLRTQEALERHSLYNLDAIAGFASTSRCTDAYSTSWSSTPSGEEKAYVGTGAAMEKVEELLMMMHDHGHQKLKVVSIVGFGGIGKTTIAMELYRKLGQQFECRAFVRTSQKPDMRRIFISMLSQVRPHKPPDNWTVHCLISTIKTHLQDKRYLIIVEDLCATSTWDIVKWALPDSNCCSRILTTTEIEDLALQSCDHDPNYVYKMQPLGEADSRKLFFSSVFGPQHKCPPELREISYNIISKCGGLPLAIVTVASILSSQPGIHQDQWDYVNKAIGYSLLTNPTWEGMKQVLDLSYNNLPQHLKACILYTGLYQEDIIIWKDDLVNQWIAEGFIQATEGQDKKEIARSFFDRLISAKLIFPVDINRNGEVLSCMVHRMVLNLVVRNKSIEENFVTAIHHSQATTTLADKVRRLSLQFGNTEDAISPTNMRLSHVRTLAFWGVFKCLPSVVQFRLLQVLILHFWGDNDSISFDITKISELFRLRYLKVTSNVTLELCTQMRGLKYLETLTIDARVSAVPSDIVHLPGLLHLRLPAETNLPNGIGHMTSLRTLGYFDLSSNSIENVQSLSMLTNLEDLQLTCSTLQTQNLNNKIQLLLNTILGRLSNLKSLTLVPRTSSYAKCIDDTGATCMAISGGFSGLSSAPALLQSLEVSPRICIFFCTPKWMGQLRKLCVLKFGVRKLDMDGVHVLSRLPALAVLSLYVQTKPAVRIVIGKTGFPVIKYFKFKCCEPCLEFKEGAMPNLRDLRLAFNACNDDQQSTMPVGIEYLSELKEVSAKIGGAGPEESHRRAAELAFRDAIRVHARCQRVNVQCVKQIIGDTDDQSRISSITAVEHSPALETSRNRDDSILRGR
ncbi:putative disease resistance RPP13-like protein 2 [Dichanthelium oligosanthes]|uniref:Putative disease resistance RPP13-like protein 2 n=1 Tax=Dichanthelium oligosanthes TaxID=888268 RepID=A0A1E5VRR7_9POAL|nr:putative disease resistance RPP13-like protein 2 [Dichanthelium oligosanthes]